MIGNIVKLLNNILREDKALLLNDNEIIKRMTPLVSTQDVADFMIFQESIRKVNIGSILFKADKKTSDEKLNAIKEAVLTLENKGIVHKQAVSVVNIIVIALEWHIKEKVESIHKEATVLSIDAEEIKFGYPDGTMDIVPYKDIDFFICRGERVNVYRSADGRSFYQPIPVPKRSRGFGFNTFFDFCDGHNKVKKVPYVLLALFLGGFGAHKFYSGKFFPGIVYILTCWSYVPLLMSFIELIVVALKNTDEDGFVEV